MLKTLLPIIIITSLILIGTNSAFSQMQATNKWFIGANGAMISFFGDLSTKDYNPVSKTKTESDFGAGITIGRELHNLLSISAFLTSGQMRGNNPQLNYHFNSTINEISFLLNFNISNALLNNFSFPVMFYLTPGYGFLQFESIKRQIDNDVIVNEKDEPDPDFKGVVRSANFFIGGIGASYSLSDNLSVTAGLGFRFTKSDLLDSHIGSTRINDRYSILSLGVIYKLTTRANQRAVRCNEEYRKFKVNK